MLLTPVYTRNLVALVVDEAHCVKKWLVVNDSFALTNWKV